MANLITSAQNPLVKRLVGLREKKRLRLQEGVFLVEGETELLNGLAGRVEFDMVVYCAKLLAGNSVLNAVESLTKIFDIGGSKTTELVEVSPRVYGKISLREHAGGVIGIAKIPTRDIHVLRLSKTPLVLVIAGVEKPGNLGALLRTADGAGVEAVIVCETEVDLYNPNVVRSSLGALFTMPTFQLSWRETRQWLRENKIRMIFTTPAAEKDYTEENYTGAVAVFFGSEKEGLPTEWLQEKACLVKIPMLGQMDSLNVSCSGAVVLYEAVRQRKKQSKTKKPKRLV